MPTSDHLHAACQRSALQPADCWARGLFAYAARAKFYALAGTFPFIRPEDDELKNVVQMQRMFTRIIEGDYIPLQQVNPHIPWPSRRLSNYPCVMLSAVLSAPSRQCTVSDLVPVHHRIRSDIITPVRWQRNSVRRPLRPGWTIDVEG